MSGSAARGCGTPRGGTRASPACPARGCQTRAGGGARSFEEAEATRRLLDPLSEYFAGESRSNQPMADWTGPDRSFLLICGNVN
jgi:hypothetical protein